MPTARKKPTRSAVSTEANLRHARVTGWITAGVLLLFVFASVISFYGLSAIGSWIDLPPVLFFAVPGAVDLAIIVYKWAEIRLRQDERKAHLAWKAKLGVLAFTALSSVGNILHIVSLENKNPVEFYGGMIFAGFMPWMIYLAATVLTDMVVKPKPKKIEKPKLIPMPAQKARRKPVVETITMRDNDTFGDTVRPAMDAKRTTEALSPRTFTVDKELKSWEDA